MPDQLSALEARQKRESGCCFLLDVREGWEHHLARIPGSVNIPLGEITSRFGELPRDQDILVYCHHGIRSQQAITLLEMQGFLRLTNLTGGIDAWSLSVDPTVPRY